MCPNYPLCSFLSVNSNQIWHLLTWNLPNPKCSCFLQFIFPTRIEKHLVQTCCCKSQQISSRSRNSHKTCKASAMLHCGKKINTVLGNSSQRHAQRQLNQTRNICNSCDGYTKNKKIRLQKKNIYFVLSYNESGVNIEGNNTFHLFML